MKSHDLANTPDQSPLNSGMEAEGDSRQIDANESSPIASSSPQTGSQPVRLSPVSPDHSAVRFVNKSPVEDHQKTVIVLGCSRGGTSAIAGLCRELGVSFGDEVHPIKHEWSPIVYSNDGTVDQAASLRNIESMNAKNDVWGWKSPKDMFALDQITSVVKNPHVIIIFRNMADVIASSAHHEALPLEAQAEHIGDIHRFLGHIVTFGTDPIAIISYERMIADTASTVDALTGWLGIKPTTRQIKAAKSFCRADNRIYKPLMSDAHDGKIDAEEIERDQLSSHLSILGPLVQELDSSMSALTASIDEAKRIVANLRRKLFDLLKMSEYLDSIGNEWGADLLYDIPLQDLRDFVSTSGHQVPYIEEKTLPGVQASRIDKRLEKLAVHSAHAAYARARADYFDAVVNRRKIQRKMDELSLKIEIFGSLAEVEAPS